uniref:Uncharacterized protein n=1 Tax=Rhizophora mucronata TaxID=61149 RepID=A0A2P2JAU1_RHIMU
MQLSTPFVHSFSDISLNHISCIGYVNHANVTAITVLHDVFVKIKGGYRIPQEAQSLKIKASKSSMRN